MVVCACLRSFRLRVLPASSGSSVLSVGTSPRRLPALCLHDAGGVGDVVTHGSCVASSTPRMCRDGKLRHKFCQFRFLRALILITRPPSPSSIEPSLQDLCRISEERCAFAPRGLNSCLKGGGGGARRTRRKRAQKHAASAPGVVRPQQESVQTSVSLQEARLLEDLRTMIATAHTRPGKLLADAQALLRMHTGSLAPCPEPKPARTVQLQPDAAPVTTRLPPDPDPEEGWQPARRGRKPKPARDAAPAAGPAPMCPTMALGLP